MDSGKVTIFRYLIKRLAKGRHLGWPLSFIATVFIILGATLLIVSYIATAETFYKRGIQSVEDIYPVYMQTECAAKQGELMAQVGYLKTVSLGK